MKHLWIVLVAFLGCTNVSTMKIHHAPDGTITVSSGKDVTAKVIDFREGNAVLHIENYSSSINTSAIDAQAARELQVIDGVLRAVEVGKAAAGVP